jgi:putative PEP-CTERM system TPR-repeat lipoprotein
MMATSTSKKRSSSFVAELLGYLVLLSMAGCGLATDNEDRLARGEKALADGDYRAAIIDAKSVLRDEPENLRGRLLLGRASVGVADGPAAEKELLRAIQIGSSPEDVAPEMARALLLQHKFQQVLNDVPFQGLLSVDAEAEVLVARGDAYAGLNQPEMARRVYSSVLQLQPDNLGAQLGIVLSFAAEGNFVQARAALDQLLDTHAENPRVWLYSGSLNIRLGDFEAAAANFQVALDLANSDGDDTARLDARAGLAESLLAKGDIDSAREHIERLAAESPQSLKAKLLIARIAYYDEDWATAQQNLQQILAVAPDYRPAQLLLGTVHLFSGNLSQAEMYLSAAVTSEPDDVRARQLLAETLLQMRKTEDAKAALAPILGGPDADPMSLQMAARASFGLQDVDEALEYLRRSVEEDPGNADLRFQLAAMLMQTNRHDEAQEVLDAIDVSGSEKNAYRRDALSVLVAMRDRSVAEALDAAQKAADTFGDRSDVINLLGIVQLANRDIDGARISFERASKLEPADILSRYYLAAMDQLAGEIDAAASRYKAILADKPDAAPAMFALGRIAVLQENLESAAEHFRRALEAAPGSANYRLSLAWVERQLGKDDRAAAVLEPIGQRLYSNRISKQRWSTFLRL